MPLVIMHFSQLSIFLDFLKVKENIFSRFAKSERIFLLLNSGMECKEPELTWKAKLKNKSKPVVSLIFNCCINLYVYAVIDIGWLALWHCLSLRPYFVNFILFSSEIKRLLVSQEKQVIYWLCNYFFFLFLFLSLSFFLKITVMSYIVENFFWECSIGLISTRKHGKWPRIPRMRLSVARTRGGPKGSSF